MKKPSPAIFALFGNPVSHAPPPLMPNAAYKKMGIDASYRTFCVEELEEAIERIKKLPLRGVSVTIPFKTAVMPYLDEVDASSRKIGAANTILHDDNGRLKG